MAREYQKHDENFKKTIVSLHENGKGISELAREYGLSKSSVSDWIKKYQNITTSTGEVTNNDEITKQLLERYLKLAPEDDEMQDLYNNL